MSRTRSIYIALVTGVLLVAAALRIVGITFGQPDPQYNPSYTPYQMEHAALPIHPDEYQFITMPLRMVLRDTLNPQYYVNPPLPTYVNYLHIVLTGAADGLSDEDRRGDILSERRYAAFSLYVVGRIHSMLGGLLAVAATFAAGRLIAGRFGGFVAAALVAVSFTMVQHGHYTTTSSIAAGLTAISVWASLGALYSEKWRFRFLILSGLAIGFATSSRYNAAPASIILCGAGLILVYRANKYRLRMARDVLIGWLCFPAAFLLGTPGAIFAFDEFWYGFTYGFGHYIEGRDATHTSVYGLFLEFQFLVIFSIGVPAALCAIWGLIVAWRGKPPLRAWLSQNSQWLVSVLLLAYLVPYSLVVLNTVNPFRSDHMLVIVIPQFALFVALGSGWLAQKLPRPSISKPVLLAVIIAVPLALSVQLSYFFAQLDTRYQMQAWVYEHVPRGSQIALVGSYNVPLDPMDYQTTQSYVEIVDLDNLQEQGAEYAIISDAFWHDVLRSGVYARPELVERVQAFVDTYATHPNRIHEISRPQWAGYDWPMHTATYWHHPSLIVLCLNQAACDAVTTSEE